MQTAFPILHAHVWKLMTKSPIEKKLHYMQSGLIPSNARLLPDDAITQSTLDDLIKTLYGRRDGMPEWANMRHRHMRECVFTKRTFIVHVLKLLRAEVCLRTELAPIITSDGRRYIIELDALLTPINAPLGYSLLLFPTDDLPSHPHATTQTILNTISAYYITKTQNPQPDMIIRAIKTYSASYTWRYIINAGLPPDTPIIIDGIPYIPSTMCSLYDVLNITSIHVDSHMLDCHRLCPERLSPPPTPHLLTHWDHRRHEHAIEEFPSLTHKKTNILLATATLALKRLFDTGQLEPANKYDPNVTEALFEKCTYLDFVPARQ